jgi:hypothetical protein
MLGKTQRVTAPTGLSKVMESAVAQCAAKRGKAKRHDAGLPRESTAPAFQKASPLWPRESLCGVAGTDYAPTGKAV